MKTVITDWCSNVKQSYFVVGNTSRVNYYEVTLLPQKSLEDCSVPDINRTDHASK